MIHSRRSSNRSRLALAGLLAPALFAGSVAAQTPKAEVIGEVRPYSFATKRFENKSKDEMQLAAEHVVRVPAASGIQLGFGPMFLSHGSLLEMTSLGDRDRQVFDDSNSDDFSYWFNGDAVRVRLYLAPGAKKDFFEISSIAVGTSRNSVDPMTYCGTDNRVRSYDRRVARVVYRRGTLAVAGSAFLSGRVNCFSSLGYYFQPGTSAHVVQFNVPLSSSSGSLRYPPISSQYRPSAWTYSNGSYGNNWAVFRTTRNTATNRHAADVQGAWFLFSNRVANPGYVTGHGNDFTPRTYNMIQQTHRAGFLSTIGTRLRYTMDTAPGSGGSPVISGGLCVGVDSHGGCTRTGGYNSGTAAWHHGFALARTRMCNMPDLRVTRILPSSTTMTSSRTYRVSFTVHNYGNRTSSPTRLGLVLSPDSRITSTDPVVAWISTPALGVGRSVNLGVNFRMPATMRSGTCYLAGWADRGFQNGELDEGNNVLATRITCVQDQRPNLRILSIAPSVRTISSNLLFSVRATTMNDSLVTAPESETGVYFSSNSTISTSDTLLGKMDIQRLLPLKYTARTISVRAPMRLPNATCYVGAYADMGLKIREFDENNGKGVAVTCRDTRADLVIDAVSSTSGTWWQAGGVHNVATRTRNTGGLPAPASRTTLHLSTDSTITVADDVIGWHNVPALNPGASILISSRVQLSPCLKGGSTRYYLGAFADGTRKIAERNENNNGRAFLAPRRIAPYAGSTRFLCFRSPKGYRIEGPNYGPYDWRNARFRGLNGSNATIDLVARRDNGLWPVFVLSSSRTFSIDTMTHIGLGLPLFNPLIQPIPANGEVSASFRFPRIRLDRPLHFYIHTVMLDLRNGVRFAGVSGNALSVTLER